jgi:hypothetical protein
MTKLELAFMDAIRITAAFGRAVPRSVLSEQR